jgi:hypothetical protein
MEKHFLADTMCGESEFKAEPWYNPYGDCIIYKMADEAVVANRVDEILTIYHSAVDERPIGFQIKGVHAIIRKCGLDGLGLHTTRNAQEVKNISILALLLAAYDDGPRTLGRRIAYAAAMGCPDRESTIEADALQPA